MGIVVVVVVDVVVVVGAVVVVVVDVVVVVVVEVVVVVDVVVVVGCVVVVVGAVVVVVGAVVVVVGPGPGGGAQAATRLRHITATDTSAARRGVRNSFTVIPLSERFAGNRRRLALNR
ncbi:MAG: hypothetical protein ACK5O2_17050 [Microthrixaceae bacterium]